MLPNIPAMAERLESDSRNVNLARSLAREIVNGIDPVEMDSASIEAALESLREIRGYFPADEHLAHSYLMALANAATVATSSDDEQRNVRLLQKVRGTLEAIDWRECDPTGYDVGIMANQYLGLLPQRRYKEADVQLGEISDRAFSGSHKQRLEWLIAVRHGFWVLLEQRDWKRIEGQIDFVRRFRRIHPDDDYEAPHALVAMLLPAFEAAEGCGDTTLADRYFDEACLLGSTAQDHYGQIKRIHDALLKENLGGPERSVAIAQHATKPEAR